MSENLKSLTVILCVMAVTWLIMFFCFGAYRIMAWANDGGISNSMHAFGNTSWGIYCCYGTLCLGMLIGLAFPASRVVAVIFVQR